jgi:HEAT repeat protein
MIERMQKWWTSWRITGMCYGAVLTVTVVAQDVSSGRFVTFKEALRERKIELTEDSLVSQLHNPDFHIRYFAALVLAQDKAKGAIPAITEALDKESNPEAHVNMALALAQLGSDKGDVSLTEACTDAHLAPLFRVYAAKYLLDLGKESCLSTLESLLRSGTDPGVRVLALSQLARFQDVGTADSQAVLESVLGALSDKESMVRIAASHALVALKSVSAIPHLKQAIAAEQDEGTRSALEGDLSQLRENNRSKRPVVHPQ